MNFNSIKCLHKIGIRNLKNIVSIILHCLYKENTKENHLKIAKNISDLGIIPIKLAQWCAYFCEIHYENNIFVNSLKYLQCECPSYTNETIEKDLEPFQDILFSWEKNPISSASIAQVYRGKLKTGENVIIKIKHKNITKDIEQWEEILNTDILTDILDLFKIKLPIELNIHEFFCNLKLQTDFDQEVLNLKKYHKHYKTNQFIKIPDYYAHNENIIIMEYVSSINFQEIRKYLSKEEYDFYFLLARILYQDNIFIKDVIHMDLHNGNWGVDRVNKRLVLYDFGWVLHEQSDFKKFFIYAHLDRKKPLEYILKRYNITDKDQKLENFVKNLSDKLDTIEAINLILEEFKDELVMDNFMLCLLSFCVFMGSVSEKFDHLDDYIHNELDFLRSNNVFIPLRSMIEKLRDTEGREKIQEYLCSEV